MEYSLQTWPGISIEWKEQTSVEMPITAVASIKIVMATDVICSILLLTIFPK